MQTTTPPKRGFQKSWRSPGERDRPAAPPILGGLTWFDATKNRLHGDLNLDCIVNSLDVLITLNHFFGMTENAKYEQGDMDGDVDSLDMLDLLNQWSESCDGTP